MTESKRLRASVSEEAYAVTAKVASSEFRSDDLAAAYRISDELRGSGREPELVEEDGRISVRVFLGDATEEAFEETANAMLEASSW